MKKLNHSYLKSMLSLIFLVSNISFCLSITTFTNSNRNSMPFKKTPSRVAVQWGEMTLHIIKGTRFSSPTYNSRCLGYLGLTMYECVVNSSDSPKTMANQVSGLSELPKPEAGQNYNWSLVLNAGQAFLLKELYSHTNKKNLAKIDSLETFILTEVNENTEVTSRSTAFGKEIATAIYEWSKTDGGHHGYLRNFDSTYQVIKGKGIWEAPARGQSTVRLPLHHFWGNNRTFAPDNFTLPVPKMEITFDYLPDSDYYKQMDAVRRKNMILTQAEKEIANWWSDDPSETFSPPGHSYHLATIAIKTEDADLLKAAATYARVGMAVADAFINCWKCKYTYHAERPASFIYYNISTLWNLYWPEPPFPAFYSGHAAQGSATATVLSDLYGNNFTFIDDSHVGRPDDYERQVSYKERVFQSFSEAANESAMSRFYGGIHTQQDNEVGLTEGKKIGQNINALIWYKNKSK
jgi:hypothetical protein